MDLVGKISLVTGAGQGIGEGIAKVLAQQGSKVILVDLNGQAAQKVSDDINNSYPDTAYSYEADLTDEKAIQAMKFLIRKFKHGLDRLFIS